MPSRFAVVLLLALTAAGCRLAPRNPGTATGSGSATDTGTGSSVATGTGSDTGSASGSDTGTAVLPTGPEPVLTSAEARSAGRLGHDLMVTVSGAAANKNLVGARLELLSGTGQPVKVAATHHGQKPDNHMLLVPFDRPARGLASVEGATVTLPDLLRDFPAVGRVGVVLVTGDGRMSARQELDVQPQPEASEGGACDPQQVQNRCPDSAGCAGDPPVCRPATAPSIKKLTFVRSTLPGVACTAEKPCPAGQGYECASDGRCARPVLRWEVADPDDDLAGLKLTFEDKAGNPVKADRNGDGLPDDSSDETERIVSITDGCRLGRCVGGADSPSNAWADSIPVLVAEPFDAGGLYGPPVKAAYLAQTVVSSGKACDLESGDQCAAASICVADDARSSATCMTASMGRRQRCASASVLQPHDGATLAAGRTRNMALWDPPETCVVPMPDGRSEAVVLLKLTKPAVRLVLTTDFPGTDADTDLTLYNGACGPDATVRGCNDNAEGVGTLASTLELANVPAGDYHVVIGHPGTQSRRFVLQADVK